MMNRLTLTAAAMLVAMPVFAEDMVLPELVTQDSPEATVAEHLDALNNCDWDRLMAQYPDDVEIHLSDGLVVAGREDVGALFAGFCTPPEDGGLIGIEFTTEHMFVVDGTVNAQWVATADFLAEPYRGSDAYVTRDGLIAAQVSTFEGTDLKFE